MSNETVKTPAELEAAVQAALGKIKQSSCVVRIDLGYSCQLLVPVAKAGAVISMLSECTIADSEYVERANGESGVVLVTKTGKTDQIEMKMGSFATMTREDYRALNTARRELEEAQRVSE